MSDAIPKSLRRAGITGYSSNLKPGDRVTIPASTFFVLFEKELMERCTTQGDAANEHRIVSTDAD